MKLNNKTDGLSTESINPKLEKVEKGNGENDRPHKQQPYQEGNENNDAPNIPGPEELPDQQKVGEDVDADTYKKDHTEAEK